MQTRAAASLEGSILGGYRVLARHAEGGAGTVYRAEEVSSGRRVAVKVMRGTPAVPDEPSVDCEALAISAVKHRHVVEYLDQGTTPDGARFLVVAWLEGEDSRARLARGPMDVAATLRLAAHIADALAAVHAAGLVHRDLTPANVVVSPHGEATLCDFGLARPGGARGERMGTPLYLAPELVGGRGVVDARADVYALGCVIFECLAGAPPFASETTAQAMLRCMLEPEPRLRTLRPEVPGWLDELVALLLRKRPEERPADGSAVVALLRDQEAPRASASTPGGVAEVHRHAFALLRVGAVDQGATVDLEQETAPAVAAICLQFGVQLDAPRLDLLLLTATDPEPRDQLRRLLGASLEILDRVADARLAVLGGRGRDMRSTIDRGRALLAHAAAGSAYADDDARRLAPAGSASFELEALADGSRQLRVRRAARGPEATLIGRDASIERLVSAMGRPQAGLVIVLGEPGLGKTAVAEAVHARLAGQADHVLRGQLHLAAEPYHAIGAWMRAWVARAGVVDERGLRVELERALGTRGAWRAAELASLLGLGGASASTAGSRSALERAIIDCVCAVVGGLPLLVDDAQWLDPPSAATLLRMLDHPDRPPLLLVARPEALDAFPALMKRSTVIERLGALGDVESRALVAHAAPTLDDRARAAVAAEGEGHPLLLLELAQATVVGGVSAPATALGLVQARLLRLSQPARRALAVAAVLGGHIAGARLRRRLRQEEMDQGVAELCAAGVLRGDESSPQMLRFATALVEQAAAALVPDTDRAAIHAGEARDLAQDPSVEPARLLRHAEGAGDAALVVLAHVLATERAVALFDHLAALRCAGEGVAWGAASEPLARLRLGEAEALLMAERYAEAEVRAREAADLLRPGCVRWVASLSVRIRAAQRRLDPVAAMAAFDLLAGAALEDAAAAALGLRTLARSAGWLMLVGLVDEGEARAALVEARSGVRDTSHGGDADLCQMRARRAQARGEWGVYIDEFERDARGQLAQGHLPAALMSRVNRAHAFFEVGLVEEAVEAARKVVDEARELGLGDAHSYCAFMLGVFLRRSGAADEARAMLARAVAESAEDPRLLGEVALERALDALDQGDLVEAERQAARGAALLERSPASRPMAHAVKSQVCLRAGQPEAALECAEQARDAAASLGFMVEDLSLVRRSLLEACLVTSDPRAEALAEEALAELEERERRVGSALAAPFRAQVDNARLRSLAEMLSGRGALLRQDGTRG